VEVVVDFDLQVDLLDLGLVQHVDVPHGALPAAELLLHALVQAHLHLGVERVLLGRRRRRCFLRRLPPAAPRQEAGGEQQRQRQQDDGGHAPAHLATHVGVEGGGGGRRGGGLQAERLHVGAVLHLVALVVVDQRLVQRQAAAAVHQVAPGAAQQVGGGRRALDPGSGARLGADDVDHLQVPLVPRLHLSINREREREVKEGVSSLRGFIVQ